MAQSESSASTGVEAGGAVDVSFWVDVSPVAIPRPRLSEERITELIASMRRRAVYPDLRRVRPVTQMERMRNVLADWRAAERQARDVSKDSANFSRLRVDCDGLRDEYQRLFAHRLAHPPPGA